jgi:methyl-accepting chemotaxis protein
MFGGGRRNNAQAQIDALNRSQAVIEFNLDGTIITANKNFLNTLGYSLEEIRGATTAFLFTHRTGQRELS